MLIIAACVLALIAVVSCSRCNNDRSTDGESSVPATMPADSEHAVVVETGTITVADIPEAERGKPAVLEFSATWCGPCKRQKPIFEQAVKKYGEKIDMQTIDVDEHPELARKYNVDAVPTFIFIDAYGKIAGRANFLDAAQLDAALHDLCSR